MLLVLKIYLLCRMVDGQKLEPLEEVVCEVEDEFAGPVIDALSLRRAEVCFAFANVQAPDHGHLQSIELTH